jgi:hypothetical protein
MNDDNVFVDLILTSVKNAQTSLQKKYLDEKFDESEVKVRKDIH